MFDEILFPVDDSEQAAAATDHALTVAAKHEATLHVLNVADTNQLSLARVQGDVVDALISEGERAVEETADRARQQGVTTVTDVIQGQPYRSIIEYADNVDIDLIVMPTHGRRKLERFLMGSTTERVLRRSTVPVLTVRPGEDSLPAYPYDSVLVPTDGSDAAGTAVELGIDLAAHSGSAFHALSIVEISGLGEDVVSEDGFAAVEEQAQDVVDDAVALAEETGLADTTGTVGHGLSIYEEVISYVEDHDIAAIVVGTQGRSGVERYLLGSVAEYLVRTAPVPVLTVQAAE
ncbi:universal stress protein [Halovenus salina]|uniref:Universal stress protein n=1 Tax=Halovenus salina TaxID=1510225 RepID=A0ABD5VWI0_9EURY|nr:universal stress protein [Halovenus salina]